MKPIPTLSQLYQAISNDLKSKLNLTDDNLRKVADAFASVESAQFKLLYLYLVDIQNNLFPDTADLAVNGGQLERIGNIHLNRPPNPATAGIYTVEVFGQAAAVIRSGLTFKSNDDSKSPGLLYVTDAQTILTGSNDFIEIRALTPGTEAALDVGNQLTITEPVVGVDQNVTVTVIIEEPKAEEETADYRQSALDAIQLEPQGGARTDYRLWAQDAQGVRRVYPYVKEGDASTIEIFTEATTEDSIDGNGTPSAALLIDVAEVIEFDPDITKPTNERGRRPMQAIIEVLSIILKPVDVQIIGLNQDTPAIRDAIELNLEFFLSEVRPFIAGADLARNKNDILLSGKMQSVVSNTLSVTNFFTDFIMLVDGIAETQFTFDGGNIPFLRNVTYI